MMITVACFLPAFRLHRALLWSMAVVWQKPSISMAALLMNALTAYVFISVCRIVLGTSQHLKNRKSRFICQFMLYFDVFFFLLD